MRGRELRIRENRMTGGWGVGARKGGRDRLTWGAVGVGMPSLAILGYHIVSTISTFINNTCHYTV